MKDCTLGLKNMNERNDYEARDAKFGLYDKTTYEEEPTTPSIKTLMDMLGMAMYGNLRRTEIKC